ncbi:ankyrin repeat-containing domain protein [Aspergillus egyptiacus]|nr:ankyrin repeat-containing domain protein [Aspergillus egyptiacus]
MLSTVCWSTVPTHQVELSLLSHRLDEMASPVYPPRVIPAHSMGMCNWLLEHTVFQDWLSRSGPGLLYVQGSPDASLAAEFVFQELRAKKDLTDLFFKPVMYFKFNQYDTRSNSVSAMAATFLSQTFSQVREPPISPLDPYHFDLPPFRDCWTDRDALSYLLRTKVMLGNYTQVQWVLDGLDKCDDSNQRLLSEIVSLTRRSDQYFKVLITGSDDKLVQQYSSDFQFVNLQQYTEQAESDPVPVEVTSRNNPWLKAISEDIKQAILSCRGDSSLQEFLFHYILSSENEPIMGAVAQPPFSANQLVRAILETVPKERHSLARQIMLWILRSMRPLTPEELTVALQVNGQKIPPAQDIAEVVSTFFGPLFSTRNGCFEPVHFVLRDVVTPDEDCNSRPWYVLDAPEQDHRSIVDSCLSFIMRPGVQSRIVSACRLSSPSSRLVLEQPSFLSYAVELWTTHYQIGYSNDVQVQPSDQLHSFLTNAKALQSWGAARWYYSNPYGRQDRSFRCSLPILCSFALPQHLAGLPVDQGPDETDMGLIQAARYGNLDTLKTLVRQCAGRKFPIREAVMAAAQSGHLDVLDNLFHHAATNSCSADYPLWMTSRIIFLGRPAILDLLPRQERQMDPEPGLDQPPSLHSAILTGDVSVVKWCLERKSIIADSLSANWHGFPPMVLAGRLGHRDMIATLAESGSSVDAEDPYGHPALWWAVLHRHNMAVLELLHRGAVVRRLVEFFSNSTESWGDTIRQLLDLSGHLALEELQEITSAALRGAIKSDDSEMFSLLLEHGADPNSLHETIYKDGSDTFSLLMEAAASNCRDIAAILLDKGVSVNYQSSKYRITALHISIMNDHQDMAKMLIAAGADTSLADRDGFPPIAHAYRNINSLRLLLDSGVLVDTLFNHGTVLYLTASTGDRDTAEFAISRGANVNFRSEDPSDPYGYSPLHWAARGHPEIVQLLLDAGADIDIRENSGMTPLMVAVCNDQFDCVQALLQYTPDLSAVDEDGRTALHWLNSTTQVRLVKALLDRGAPLGFRDNYNDSALDEAVEQGNIDVVKFLLDRRALADSDILHRGPLHNAASCGNMEMLRLLVGRGASVNFVSPDSLRCTPLHRALLSYRSTEEEKESICRYLVEEAGANVQIPSPLYGSTLSVSLGRCSLGLCQWLLQQGATFEPSGRTGSHAIHYAALRNPDFLRLVMDSQPDLTIKDALGRTPLHYAVASGSLSLVELILSETQGLINAVDNQGWTPLLWACRTCASWTDCPEISFPMIQLLLSHGADLWVRGKGFSEDWSPLKLATLCGASGDILRALTPRNGRRVNEKGEEETWDPEFHTTRVAKWEDSSYCDGCLCDLYKEYHQCGRCLGRFKLIYCFRCTMQKEDLHPGCSGWELVELGFVEDETPEKIDEGQTNTEGKAEQIQEEEDGQESDWSD